MLSTTPSLPALGAPSSTSNHTESTPNASCLTQSRTQPATIPSSQSKTLSSEPTSRTNATIDSPVGEVAKPMMGLLGWKSGMKPGVRLLRKQVVKTKTKTRPSNGLKEFKTLKISKTPSKTNLVNSELSSSSEYVPHLREEQLKLLDYDIICNDCQEGGVECDVQHYTLEVSAFDSQSFESYLPNLPVPLPATPPPLPPTSCTSPQSPPPTRGPTTSGTQPGLLPVVGTSTPPASGASLPLIPLENVHPASPPLRSEQSVMVS